MTDNSRDHAGVIFPPPFIYLIAIVVGALLHYAFPVSVLPTALAQLLGAVLVVASFAIVLPAVMAMRRAGTHIRPDEPTMAIVTTGPFRFTRNPIYLSLTLLYSGAALLINALWPLLLLPVVLVVMTYGVIKREEAYLERKFGATYTTYKARVRRWL